MVLKAEPLFEAVEGLRTSESTVVLLSPRGELFGQAKAEDFSRRPHLIFICGHYEGVDERVSIALVDEEISIGVMQASLPPIFSKVPLSEEQGIFELSRGGDSGGFVAFLRYADDKEARSAFREMASGIGRYGARVSGVGHEGYASRRPAGSRFAIVFRREGVVIYAMLPAKSQVEMVKFGRAVDRRVRDFQRNQE